MAWLTLVCAGLCEVFGVLAIQRLTKKRSVINYILLAAGFGTSFLLLSYSMRHISMGTAYAIWTGIGTAGSTLLGMFVFGEPKEWKRVFFIALIVSSVIGLKLVAT